MDSDNVSSSILGKRNRVEEEEYVGIRSDEQQSQTNERTEEEEFMKILERKSTTELLFDSFRDEFRGCVFPPMIFLHQLTAFYQSMAQSSSHASVTCTDNLSTADMGDLDRDVLQMRRSCIIKVIVPRVGLIQDSLLVNTEDYIQHLATYVGGKLLRQFAEFMRTNDHMSFSKNTLLNEMGLDPADIDALMAQGILRKDNFMSFTPNVNIDDASTSSLWLSSPIIGSIISAVDEAQVVVLRTLRKSKYKELLESKLANAYRASLIGTAGPKLLPWRYVMLEMYHRNIIRSVKSPSGTVIRMSR